MNIEDYKRMNCSEFGQIGDKPYLSDEDLTWPTYRDWMTESSQHYDRIRALSTQITTPEALQKLVQEESML